KIVSRSTRPLTRRSGQQLAGLCIEGLPSAVGGANQFCPVVVENGTAALSAFFVAKIQPFVECCCIQNGDSRSIIRKEDALSVGRVVRVLKQLTKVGTANVSLF